VSEEETRNLNLCVFVQRGQITNGEEPLREFWMNEEKGLHLGRNGVWQVVFMSQALKPKGVIGNGLSKFCFYFNQNWMLPCLKG
jgi:hypothetical protein